MSFPVRSVFSYSSSIVVATVLSVGLIGCGGGGSSTENTPPPPVTIDPNIIDGTAVKGIIAGGIVTAYQVTNGMVTDQVLDSTVTDENGDYSIEIPGDYTGAFSIVITPNDDVASPSLMTCDAASGCGAYDTSEMSMEMDTNSNGVIDFGEQFKISAEFSMRAFASTPGGEDMSVNVTPLTDIAAAYAETLPQGVTELSVDIGNSQVANLFGITGDITSLTPPDLTNADDLSTASGEELEYALFSAAIGGIAGNSGNDVATVLDTLSQTFADNNGQLPLNSASAIDFGDIAQETSDTAAVVANENAELADELNTLSDTYQDEADTANTAGEGEVTDAEPSPTAGTEDLDVVKAFVADVRTWGNVITLEAQAEAEAFDMQITMAQEFVAMETDSMGMALSLLGDLTIIMEGRNLTTVNLADFIPGATGTMVYDPDNLMAEVDGVVEGVTVVAEITLTGNTAMSEWVLSVVGEVENANAAMAISSGTVTISFDEAFDPFLEPRVEPEPVPTEASVALTGSVAQKASSVVIDPISFEGALEIDIVQGVPETSSTGEVNENFVPSHLGVTGTFSNTSGASFAASFTANIANAATFTPPTPLVEGSISEGLATYSFNADATELTVLFPSYSLMMTWDESIAGSGQWGISVVCQGPDGMVYCEDTIFDFPSVKEYADYMVAQQNGELFGYWTDYVRDEGEYQFMLPQGVTEFDLAGGTLDGVLMYADSPDEDESNWIDFDFQMSFALELANFPTAAITLSGDRTGFESGEVTAEVSYGARSILIELDNVTETGNVTITNQDGAQLMIDISADPQNEDQIVGQVKLADTVWAEIRYVDGAYLIVYADGTFESLN